MPKLNVIQYKNLLTFHLPYFLIHNLVSVFVCLIDQLNDIPFWIRNIHKIQVQAIRYIKCSQFVFMCNLMCNFIHIFLQSKIGSNIYFLLSLIRCWATRTKYSSLYIYVCKTLPWKKMERPGTQKQRTYRNRNQVQKTNSLISLCCHIVSQPLFNYHK